MKEIDKEQAIKELEQLKKEFDERTKKLEEIINRKDVIGKPKHGEYCYYQTSSGVKRCYWTCHDVDEYRYATGNYYQTEQEAQDASDARIILTDMQRMADEANGKKIRAINADAGLFYIAYVPKSILSEASVRVYCDDEGYFVCMSYGIGFKTLQSAEEAKDALISKYGEDKIKMALSGTWR